MAGGGGGGGAGALGTERPFDAVGTTLGTGAEDDAPWRKTGGLAACPGNC